MKKYVSYLDSISVDPIQHDRTMERLSQESHQSKKTRVIYRYAGLAACAAVLLLCVWAIPGLFDTPIANPSTVTPPDNPSEPVTDGDSNFLFPEEWEVAYSYTEADWPVYQNIHDLAANANLIISGKVTGVSFQMLDMKTGLPPTEETEEHHRQLSTMYDVEVITVYEGNPANPVKIGLPGGLYGVLLDDQLLALGDDAEKGIPIIEGMPPIEIGETYLFVLYQFENAAPTILNTTQSVFNLRDPFAKDIFSYLSANDIILHWSNNPSPPAPLDVPWQIVFYCDYRALMELIALSGQSEQVIARKIDEIRESFSANPQEYFMSFDFSMNQDKSADLELLSNLFKMPYFPVTENAEPISIEMNYLFRNAIEASLVDQWLTTLRYEIDGIGYSFSVSNSQTTDVFREYERAGDGVWGFELMSEKDGISIYLQHPIVDPDTLYNYNSEVIPFGMDVRGLWANVFVTGTDDVQSAVDGISAFGFGSLIR